MSAFLAPLALGLLSLLPVIVIMYLLKLKRQTQVVPSTLLWRRSIQDMVANAPFQKLRNNLLMWLQLLALLLLVFALSRPIFNLQSKKGETLILLMDMSASMQVREEGNETRMDLAKKSALAIIDQMNAGEGVFGALAEKDEMMILGFAHRTFPIQPMTSDRNLLRQSVQSLTSMDTETNLEDAGYILQEKTMVMEGDALVPNPRVRVILISDGGVGSSIESISDLKNVNFISIGKSVDNQGIIAADVRESFSGTSEKQLFASLLNAGNEARDVFLQLVVSGNPLGIKKLNLAPESTSGAVFDLPTGTAGSAELKFVDHSDSFVLDDLVQLELSPKTAISIHLVTTGNPFLERVLSSDPRHQVTVSSTPPANPDPLTTFTVYDRQAPDQLPPGNYVFIAAAPRQLSAFQMATEATKNPVVFDWNRTHPISRFCNFERLAIGEAFPIQGPPDMLPLVEGPKFPLVTYWEDESHRILIVGFDILKSYWPLDASFPIFFANLSDYWSRSSAAGLKPGYKTGQTIAVTVPPGASSASLIAPRIPQKSMVTNGQTMLYLTDTDYQGVGRLLFEGETIERRFPLNLFSELESRISPESEVNIGGGKVVATTAQGTSRQEIWPWLILCALGILLLEWRIYCRRTFL